MMYMYSTAQEVLIVRDGGKQPKLVIVQDLKKKVLQEKNAELISANLLTKKLYKCGNN